MIFIYDFSTLQFYNYQAFSKKLADQYTELEVVIKPTYIYCIVKYIDQLFPNFNTGLQRIKIRRGNEKNSRCNFFLRFLVLAWMHVRKRIIMLAYIYFSY